MLCVGSLNGESDTEDSSYPDGLGSPQYSDHVNSDVEIELYNRLHHGVVNEGNSFGDMFTNPRTTVKVSNPQQNGSCNRHVVDEVVCTESANGRQEVSARNLIMKQVPTETSKAGKGPNNRKRKYNTPLGLKKTKFSQTVGQRKKVSLDVSMSETTDESSLSDISLLCVDECGGSEDDLMINVKDGKFRKIKNASSSNVSTSLGGDVIFVDHTSSKELKSKLQPVIIDIEDSSESSNEEMPLSPKKVRKMGISEVNDDVWHLDPEDKYPSKKRMKRYHDIKPKCRNCGQEHKTKFCPKVRSIKCYICGEDHKFAACKKKVCSFCYELGHNYKKCPNKRKVSQMQCEICKLSGHTFNLCPDLWRRFHATTTASNVITQLPMATTNSDRVFCYNCGARGHFGYECSYPLSRISSSPSWPYVVSYKNPQNLGRCRSAIIQTDRSLRKKNIANNRKKKHVNPELSKVASTPVNFRRRKNGLPIFKKKKLLFQEQNFLRTPSNSETLATNNEFISNRKRRRQRKRKIRGDMPFRSSNYTV